jgi:hypothetical protein
VVVIAIARELAGFLWAEMLAGRDAHGPSAVEGRKKVRALH